MCGLTAGFRPSGCASRVTALEPFRLTDATVTTPAFVRANAHRTGTRDESRRLFSRSRIPQFADHVATLLSDEHWLDCRRPWSNIEDIYDEFSLARRRHRR